MLVVAVIPGSAVFAVISASFASGLKRGAYLTAGLVAADYIFILLAAFGFAAVTQLMGEASKYLRIGCAVYLCYFGTKLIFQKSYADGGGYIAPASFSGRSEVLTGLLITLSNPKAILFYAALFPAFVNP